MCCNEPQAPQPVNAGQIIGAQSAANKDAVRESVKVNAIDEFSPYGSLTYERDAEGLPTSRTTQYSPGGQQVFDKQQQLANTLAGYANNQAGFIPQSQFSLEGLPQSPNVNDFSADRDKFERAYYDRSANLLRPEFEQQREEMNQSYADRGIPQGGEAYNRGFNRFDQGERDAYARLAQDAVQAGAGEQSRLFGLSTTGRNNAIQERLLERSQPFNELSAFLQGSPALQGPQFQNAPQYSVAPPDVTGAYGLQQAGQNNAYNQQMGTYQANLNGLYGLAGAGLTAGIAASDRRLKQNIIQIGTTIAGLGIYLFNYIWGGPKQIGLMADEVKHINPEAVFSINGFDVVDYGKVPSWL